MNPDQIATHNPKNAVALIRLMEPILAAAGYHAALAGSVLIKGGSEKDTDIIIYPHNPKKQIANSELCQLLTPLGFTYWTNNYIDYPGRQIQRSHYAGRRVDLFFLT